MNRNYWVWCNGHAGDKLMVSASTELEAAAALASPPAGVCVLVWVRMEGSAGALLVERRHHTAVFSTLLPRVLH
jgi:hypothetical protein